MAQINFEAGAALSKVNVTIVGPEAIATLTATPSTFTMALPEKAGSYAATNMEARLSDGTPVYGGSCVWIVIGPDGRTTRQEPFGERPFHATFAEPEWYESVSVFNPGDYKATCTIGEASATITITVTRGKS